MSIPVWETMTRINQEQTVRVDWINIGEGHCEDYDPDDPEDENLLRFDVYIRAKDATQDPDSWWEAVDDASYCTNMPFDAPDWMLERGLDAIMRQFEDAYQFSTDSGHKKTMEWMSWIGPEDITEKNEH
jgi:hypothetical protein